MSGSTGATLTIGRAAPSSSEEGAGIADFQLGEAAPVAVRILESDWRSAREVPEGTLEAVDPSGDVVGALRIRFVHRVTVPGKVTLIGADSSSAVRVAMTVTQTPPKLTVNLQYDADVPALPRQLLPSLRFLRALRPANRLGVSFGERRVGRPQELPTDTEFPAAAVELVRSLAFVQDATGVEFPMPHDMDREDLRSLREAELLLQGKPVTGHWNDVTLVLRRVDNELWRAIDVDADNSLELTAHAAIELAGHVVDLGDATYTFASARIQNHETLLHAAHRADIAGVEARFEPGSDDSYEMRLVDPPGLGIDSQRLAQPVVVPTATLAMDRDWPGPRNAFEVQTP